MVHSVVIWQAWLWVQTPTNACEHMNCKYLNEKIWLPCSPLCKLAGVAPEEKLRFTTGDKSITARDSL